MVERFGDDDVDLWFLIGDFFAAVQPPGLEEERRHQRLADAGEAYDRAAALGADERAVALRRAALDHRRGEPGTGDRVARIQDLLERDGGGAHLWSLTGSVWGRLGDPRRAEECLRRALALDPHDASCASNLVDSLRVQQRFADLVAFGEQWRATTGHLPDAAMLNNLGVAYESLRNAERAEDCYRRAAAADPSDVTIAANLMDAVRRRGAHADAALVGERLLAGEHPPLTAYFWNTLGLVYGALGRHARSADCHRCASELDRRSAAYVANAVMSLNAMSASEEAAALGEAWIADPANVPGAELWNNLGVAHAALGAHERAVACYLRALELHPRDVTSTGNLVASLRQTGALAEAIRAFEEIAPLAEAESNAPVLNQGGLAHMESGDLAGAELLYRAAMRIDAARPEYVSNLASVLRLQGRPAEAVAAAESWLDGHGPDPALLSTLGVAADAAGEPARAVARYREALAADPCRADVATLLLSCLHRQGDDPGACVFADEWLARGAGRPGDAFWGLLGVARYALGDFPGAEECFRTAFAMAPANPNHACNMQLVLSAQGRSEDLQRLGEEWLGREDVHPPAETWTHLGVALFEAGRFEQALRCQERGYALKPADPVIAGNVVHCLCEAGRGAEAIGFGEAWLAAPGHEPNAGFLNTMGFVEFRARRPAAARGYFARAVEMEPSNATFAENLTRAADLAAASAGAPGGRSQ